MPKPKPALPFDLDELSAQVDRYERPPGTPAIEPEPAASPPWTPAPAGRPRTLDKDAAPISVRLSPGQRRWLLEEAARRTLDTGERHDVSRILRELIDRARGGEG